MPADADPYRYYDLDWMVVNPNMDPHIRQFEPLEKTDTETVVRTGFEAIIRKKYDCPMPEPIRFNSGSTTSQS